MFGVCLQSCEASHGPMGHPPAPPPSLLQLACWQSSSCAEWFGCGRHTHGECRCRHHRYSSGWPPHVSHSGLSVPKLSKTCHFVFGTASCEKINIPESIKFTSTAGLHSDFGLCGESCPQFLRSHEFTSQVLRMTIPEWQFATTKAIYEVWLRHLWLPHLPMHLMTCQPLCKFSNSSTPTHCIPVCQAYSSWGRLDKTHRHFVVFAVCSSHPSVTSDMWPFQRDRQWHLEKCPHVEQSLPSPSVESPRLLSCTHVPCQPMLQRVGSTKWSIGTNATRALPTDVLVPTASNLLCASRFEFHLWGRDPHFVPKS